MTTWEQVTQRIQAKIGQPFGMAEVKEAIDGYSNPAKDRYGQPARPFVHYDLIIRKPKLYNALTLENGDSYNSEIFHLYGYHMPQRIYLELDENNILQRVKLVASAGYRKIYG